ncbi:thrombospondin type-1 domain-containing protein 7B-like isoform X2 [Portunus trituberculatus]|uniref:thrombospondin type-1 domain-containing protein 7B-like isoform X2 n=1 Tax=Portunus trituberculatus TaxID=210409 RepID=UPI001E1CBCF3|nr:thrombospondin type-1 domain-containing protein 7B-like isoform X2 [Portunus trituberculatus]
MPPVTLYAALLLGLWASTDAHARDSNDFKNFGWKTGEWGVCWSERGCGLGSEERTVWCADARGRPLPPTLCKDADRPPNSRSCYTSCPDGEWLVGAWSPCQVGADRARDAEGFCHGLRNRSAKCQVEGSDAPLDQCPRPRPSPEAACITTCPQDCVVGPWGEWVPCSSCNTSQRRTRSVVVAPTQGGSPCPPLSESRPCLGDCTPSGASSASLQEDTEPMVRLRVGEWGPCQPSPTIPNDPLEDDLGDPPEDNSISFLNSNEQETTFPEAAALQAVKEEDSGRSSTVRPSQVPEAWTDVDMPQVGRQERALTCVHLNGTLLSLSVCLAGRKRVAERVRTCVVNRDCTVTQWSSWSTVVPGCVAPSGLVVREVRERRRTSPSLQHGDGVPCPHLLERHTLPDPSLQPCDTRYQWVSSAWGPCVGQGAPVTCGGGVQERELTCVRAADHVPVQDDMCIHVEPPPRVQRCEVGCERDCQVGPWSAWGICTPTDCTAYPPPATPGFRRRRRQVVVTPSPGGAECPPLEEQSECHEAQCHQWVMGPWSACLLNNPAHSCGIGYQLRNASCLDSAGAPAPTEECEAELGAAPKNQECYVPCSYDCVTGSWSPWSPCSRPCASQLHVGYTQRNTSVVAPPGPGGKGCPPPDELTQVETCRVEPCGGAAWSPGPWGRCSLPSRAVCGPGRQTRELYCRDHLNNTLPSYRCSGMARPDVERACEVSCGTACTVTSWSGWSPCLAPDPCPIDGVLVASSQRRWRRILVEASEGGNPCPVLHEERGCAHAPVTCTTHHWRTGPWSRCALADDVECGKGFRVRRVECVDATGQTVEPTQCLLGKTMVPESSVECHVDCARPCVLSSWSSWTPCPARPPCGTASVRKRQLLDATESNPECRNLTLRESRECRCHNFYSTPAGPWSTCIVGEVTKDEEVAAAMAAAAGVPGPRNGAGLCGVGKRYQALLCTRDDGVLAHPSSCNHAGLKEEPCMMECPSDCRMGPWGAWSACNASCGAGIQYRNRKVLEPSLWGGRPCPEAQQWRTCWGSCSSEWVPGGWSECLVADEKDCGDGTQTRSIRCMKQTLTGLKQEVSHSECDAALRPHTQQGCRVSCPGQCVVSSWSAWSACPTGCSEHIRSRHRQVVRLPMSTGEPCPALKEEEPCVQGVSCWQYSWHVGNWTSCVPLGLSPCGEGVRNRPVTCLRSDGVAVPEWRCPRDTRPSPSETWCYVDCPIDCEVTSWMLWDDSKCSCGENPGEMTRRRFLSVNPSESGRPCPSLLQETRPCPAIPCYTWERGPWSQCHLQGGSCGHGYVERNVSCVGPGGQAVDSNLCLALVHVGGHTWPYLARALDLNTKDGCYVPCEGDCELTEWAPWSHCHRDCSRGHQGGTQARSRAVLTEGTSQRDGVRGSCPGPLWETRPCLAGPCLNFTWQIINGTVQCVRSDGLVVTGGCAGESRPCLPECTVRGSLCSAVGACVCRSGMRPLYSEKQRFHLTSCVPIRNLTFPLPQPFSGVKYLPEDINVWMFAMVGVGSAFVVFVVISMYLLCQSPREHTTTPLTLRRQKNLRHRAV